MVKIQYPENKEFKEFRAYLRITMKTFSHTGTGWGTMSSMFSDYSNQVIDSGKKILNALLDKNNASQKEEEINKNQLNNISTKDSYRTTGYKHLKEVFVFETYIPADFGISITGDWSSTELISTAKITETAIKGGGSLLGNKVGNFVSNQYTLLKNQLQYKTHQTLTPLEIKQFNPSFLDTTINFDFRPKNSIESDKIDTATRILNQAVKPNSKNGEWFDFPALFDVQVMIKNNKNGQEYVKSNKDKTSDLFTNFKDLGMTSFNLTSDSGNNLDMKFRQDGTLPVYKLSMSFTSTKKYYQEDDKDSRKSVSERVAKIGEKYKE